jgi:predicted DNA-binding protein
MAQHPRLSVTLHPSVEESIEKLMEATGLHKSAIIKEALEVGINSIEHKYGLTTSRRVSEMTQDELAALMDDWLKKALTNNREQ